MAAVRGSRLRERAQEPIGGEGRAENLVMNLPGGGGAFVWRGLFLEFVRELCGSSMCPTCKASVRSVTVFVLKL